MKKSTIVICVSVILVLAIAGSLFLLLKPQGPSLFLQIGKPVQFDADGMPFIEYTEEAQLPEI